LCEENFTLIADVEVGNRELQNQLKLADFAKWNGCRTTRPPRRTPTFASSKITPSSLLTRILNVGAARERPGISESEGLTSVFEELGGYVFGVTAVTHARYGEEESVTPQTVNDRKLPLNLARNKRKGNFHIG
jgi:hypothetical protein